MLILYVGMDNFEEVYQRIKSSISSQYDVFGKALGMAPDYLDDIREERQKALEIVLRAWLKQQNYKPEMHGHPSWRKLVEAVDKIDPNSESNHELAKTIASEHPIPGNVYSLICFVPDQYIEIL